MSFDEFKEKADEISIGWYILIAIGLVPLLLVVHFTAGLIPAFVLKFAWNSALVPWLNLPTASIWNVLALLSIAVYLPGNEATKNLGWKASLISGLVLKPLFVMAVILIVT